jgi:SAM-dependent methyltransferase
MSNGDVRVVPAGDFDYEAGGQDYSLRRQTDPRIAALVHAALGAARTVLNVGAGAGSYEPRDRYVATAERLPFDDDSFDAAMATVTVHQWADLDSGLREMRRVSRGPVVILTFDAQALAEFWLNEYVPEVLAVERRRFPTIEHIAAVLGGDVCVTAVPIPIDCADGFGEAYYARPEAFLDPEVRRSQSGWGLVESDAVERGVARLRDALASGEWDERHGHLRSRPERIGAVRLVVARADPG